MWTAQITDRRKMLPIMVSVVTFKVMHNRRVEFVRTQRIQVLEDRPPRMAERASAGLSPSPRAFDHALLAVSHARSSLTRLGLRTWMGRRVLLARRQRGPRPLPTQSHIPDPAGSPSRCGGSCARRRTARGGHHMSLRVNFEPKARLALRQAGVNTSGGRGTDLVVACTGGARRDPARRPRRARNAAYVTLSSHICPVAASGGTRACHAADRIARGRGSCHLPGSRRHTGPSPATAP